MTQTNYTPIQEAESELAIARTRWLEGFLVKPYCPNIQVQEEYYRASNRWLDLVLDEMSVRAERGKK